MVCTHIDCPDDYCEVLDTPSRKPRSTVIGKKHDMALPSGTVRRNDPATSREAAEKVDTNARGRVVEEVFCNAYPGDLANEEVAKILGVKDGSISSRVTELRNMGVLGKTQRRHKSDDGGSQQCHVWVPPDKRKLD